MATQSLRPPGVSVNSRNQFICEISDFFNLRARGGGGWHIEPENDTDPTNK